ncbi:MAG: hypothetical protein KDB63_21745 [Nocardioidaceae bacterium]|nr:hypothetical protein [Nocardioidaceae bacterium]
MNTGATHPFVEDYLARLSAESWRLLPHDQARELVEDVREHLASAITEQSSEAEIRDVLDRLGPPSEVVAAAAPEGPPPGPAGFGPPTPRPPTFGNVEVGALLCLVLAEVIFLIYPVAALLCLAGFVLLLVSRLWTAGEKVLGALFLATGFPLVFGTVLFTPTPSSQGEECSQSVRADGTSGPLHCTQTGGDGGANPWVFWVAAAIYLALQAYTIWRLVRARRRVVAH